MLICGFVGSVFQPLMFPPVLTLVTTAVLLLRHTQQEVLPLLVQKTPGLAWFLTPFLALPGVSVTLHIGSNAQADHFHGPVFADT